MSRWPANLPDITIASGASVSTSTPDGQLDDAVVVTIVGPATLTTTVNVQGTLDGTTWVDIQSGNTDVQIATGGNAAIISPMPFRQIRVTDVAISEATQRNFQVKKQFDVSR